MKHYCCRSALLKIKLSYHLYCTVPSSCNIAVALAKKEIKLFPLLTSQIYSKTDSRSLKPRVDKPSLANFQNSIYTVPYRHNPILQHRSLSTP